MLVEEFRLHTELFGRKRFFVFPVFTALLVGSGVWLLGLTGTSLETVIAGLFALVFFFGLQVGTIGLIGRDAMRDVLGDVTLLVFSARTLPVSRRRLLGTFLAKDLVYYVVLFLSPLVLGFLPVAVTGGMTPAEIALLWVGIAATFAFGTAGSLALAGIATRSRLALLAVLGVVVAGIVSVPEMALALTPYALYATPSVGSALTSGIALVALLVAGPLLFEPPERGGVRRIERNRYRRLTALGGGLTARPLLEVSRSSGSVWKVAFSLGVLFAVTALLLDRIVAATGLEPAAGIAFGALLGLGTFTTYNWLTQFDDPREYLRYPEHLSAVYAGKQRAFFVLSLPIGAVYLAGAAVWYPVADLLLGMVVFPLVSVYVFGVTAYLTGLSPNDLLFDTVLFAIYGVALALVAVPLLVASLAYGEFPLYSTGVAVTISVVAASVGLVLARYSGPRWHDRLRAES